MPIKVTCAGCGATLSTPDSAAGKRAKCPKCGSILEIPNPAAEDDAMDALSSPFDGLTEEEMTAGEVKQEDRKPCPACGEMIMRGAAKCHFCGEIFDPTLKEQQKKKRKKRRKSSSYDDEEMTAFDWILAICCGCIGCWVAIYYIFNDNPKGKTMLLVSLAPLFFCGFMWFVINILLAVLVELPAQ